MISVGSEVQVLPGPPENGGIAQLGEHLLCKQGVVGSNPSASTRKVLVSVLCSGLEDDRERGKRDTCPCCYGDELFGLLRVNRLVHHVGDLRKSDHLEVIEMEVA